MSNILSFELSLNKGLRPLLLGMKKGEVDNILGESGIKIRGIYYYFNHHIQLEFDDNNYLIFIQLCNSKIIKVYFNNMNLFELEDYKIAELFNNYAMVDKNDPEFGYVYNYKPLQLVFWRGSNPDNLKQELENLDKTDKEYLSESLLYQNEITKFSYFETIAIYCKGYYE